MTIEHNPKDSLIQIRKLASGAAIAAGRQPDSVAILAVSKQQPASVVRSLAEAGQLDFGESYLQEALLKMHALADLPLCWHFIGQLQSNKTAAVAEHFHWVHTLDRDKIATRLNAQRSPHAPPLQVCIQVRLADEPGKGGVWPEQVLALAQHIQGLPQLKLRGLMCIPPPVVEVIEQRAQFAHVHGLLDQLNTQGMELDTLSMGMSGDFAAAIAAGATLVRIGTALFGERL